MVFKLSSTISVNSDVRQVLDNIYLSLIYEQIKEICERKLIIKLSASIKIHTHANK